MNRLEMIQALAQNPKRKAKLTKSLLGYKIDEKDCEIFSVNVTGEISCENKHCILSVFVHSDKTEWEIIEPPRKLKEMSFGEAMYRLTKNPNWCYADMKQVDTGIDAAREWQDILLEEYLGKWTVEGIYEE